jgi:hypothetical protein
VIELKPGDKIWLASAPAEFEQPTGPTVIFDLSAFDLDPEITLRAYREAGWTIIEAVISETTT